MLFPLTVMDEAGKAEAQRKLATLNPDLAPPEHPLPKHLRTRDGGASALPAIQRNFCQTLNPEP